LPPTWRPGSSIYHLDERYNDTPDALMTYSLSNGESVHDPGDVARGILRDIGWNMAGQPDLAISNRVSGLISLAAGSPVTLTLSVENRGTTTARDVVVTDPLPEIVVSPSYEASPSLAGLTVVRGTTYVWQLPDLAPGASGVITVRGTIDSALQSAQGFWNTATIESPDGDLDVRDNQSTVLIGGYAVFLPAMFGD
jgi:uncharacterized repeat protein (TIGR01451 family)